MFNTSVLSNARWPARKAVMSGAVVLAAGLLLSGCAYSQTQEGQQATPDQQALQERVEQRYAHWMNQDYEKVAEFKTPARRSMIDMPRYKHRLSLREIEAVDVEGIECRSDIACDVNLRLTFDQIVPGSGERMGTRTATSTERWVWRDNQWWYVPKR